MLHYDLRQQQEIKVIGTTVLPTPKWAVYYDFEASKTVTKPVICYTVREHIDMRAGFASQVKLYPVVFDSETGSMVEESGDTDGYLGLSDEAEPKAAAWADKIRDLKKQKKGKAE